MSTDNFDPAQWQPVRFPGRVESRSGDFPPLDTFYSRELEDMTAWCEKKCRGRWHHEVTAEQKTVFWFERDGDAMAFAIDWFPYKCF